MTAWDVRLLLALAMLVGATGLDLRARRVPNLYWFPFAVAAALLALTDLQQGNAWPWLAVAAVLACMSYGLFWLGAFGGADAKAIMVLAFLLPHPQGVLPLVPVLGHLALASLLVAVVPFATLASNLLRRDVAWPGIVLGWRMPVATARRSHVWPIQEVAAPGRVRWRIRRRIGMDTGAAYDALEAAGVTHVWTTPKVPFLLPLSAAVAGWPLAAAFLDRLLGA